MNSFTTNDNFVDHSRCRLTCDFDFLRHSRIFGGLNLEIIRLFAYVSLRRSYSEGDYLIEQGKMADQAFILVNGTVEISVEHKNQNITLQNLKAGAFFGELALLAQFEWFFKARALENTDALIIKRTAFQKVIDKFPEHKDRIIEHMIQLRVSRLVEQTNYMLDQYLDSDTLPVTPLI